MVPTSSPEGVGRDPRRTHSLSLALCQDLESRLLKLFPVDVEEAGKT